MKVYTDRLHAVPMINSNGNNAKELIKQIAETYNAVEDARNKLHRLDMYDGRNSKDSIHKTVLKNDRIYHSEILNEVMTYLRSVLVGINKQIRENRK